MIHIVFNRPTGAFKVFEDALLRFQFQASGDAWGDGVSGPYGHDYPIAPGHYALTRVERLNPALASEGPGQIYVADLNDAAIAALINFGKAQACNDKLSVGAIVLPTGQLAHFNRSEVMLHGGGTNLGVPACFADYQELCKTFGCTRLHNADLRKLMDYLEPILSSGSQHVVYSVIGDPAPCSR